ncbi:polysaccharide deacetylase family protein [Glutamicibacter arilaitensis]|uniref:polysaccharide deacetylase family protein n=2 Tax=Glutamicibacter arilaitensis TaxID=256701 RepID=UPI0002D8F4EE
MFLPFGMNQVGSKEEENMEHRSRRWALKAGAASLGAVAAGLLGGCSASGPATATRSASPSASGAASSTPPAPAPSASPSSARQYPTRAQILSEFKNQRTGEFGLEVKGIELGLPTATKSAALTFDACGGAYGSGIDHALLDTLRDHKVPATLFINQRWARSNGAAMEELVADPLFEIANHGTSHAPLSVAGQSAYGLRGTGSVGEAYDEVMGNQKYLAGQYAVDARFFRSGTAHMDEVSAAMCRKLGLIPMNFTVNLDAGASFPAATVAAQMQLLSAGSVGIGHFNQPESGTAKGIALGLVAALDSGLEFITLSEAW